jgi:hypothetical protein
MTEFQVPKTKTHNVSTMNRKGGNVLTYIVGIMVDSFH